MNAILATVRQWNHPREFRIAPPAWPPDLISAFEKLAKALAAPPAEDNAAIETQTRLLADIATVFWRQRRQMLQPGTDRPREEMRRVFRHVESGWDVLGQAGVEILDHTDAPFSPGQSLKVIEYQPTPGLGREKVLETIKPTIYLKKQLVQMGEVIVGTPVPSQPKEQTNKQP